MSSVVDSSIFLSWACEDEQEPLAYKVMRQVMEEGALVPNLWHLEVSNGLLMAERRGRIHAAGLNEILRNIGKFDLEVESETHLRATAAISELARAHGLTVYDAAYLECAARRGLPLATLDKALAKAAKKAGVKLAS